MKKSKKKLKGMTLVEMIISIAVFALMGGILILVGNNIDATSKAGNNLKNKVVAESPYAANHRTSFTDKSGATVDLPKEEIDIVVKVNASGQYADKDSSGNTVIKQYGPHMEVDMKADKYKTEGIYTDGMSAEQIDTVRNKGNGGLNLEFFEIQSTTAPSTP